MLGSSVPGRTFQDFGGWVKAVCTLNYKLRLSVTDLVSPSNAGHVALTAAGSSLSPCTKEEQTHFQASAGSSSQLLAATQAMDMSGLISTKTKDTAEIAIPETHQPTANRLVDGIYRGGGGRWGFGGENNYLEIIPTHQQTRHKLKKKRKHSFCLEIFGFSSSSSAAQWSSSGLSSTAFQPSLRRAPSHSSLVFRVAPAVFYASDVAGGLSWAFSMAVPYGTDLLKKPNWKDDRRKTLNDGRAQVRSLQPTPFKR